MLSGVAFHEVLDKYSTYLSKNSKESDLLEANEILTKVLKKYDIEDRQELREAIENYLAGYEEDIRNLYGTELKIYIDDRGVACREDEAIFMGILDKVYVDENQNYLIVDYKTGQRVYADTRQFEYYALLLASEVGGVFNSITAKADFARLGFDKVYHTATEYPIETFEEIMAQIEKIEKEKEFRPVISDGCLTCPFRSVCPAIKDKISTETSQANIALEYLRLKAEIKNLEIQLKAMAEHEPITINKTFLGYATTVKKKYDIDKVVQETIDRGLPFSEVFAVNSAKAKKYNWIEPISEEQVSRFTVKKAK